MAYAALVSLEQTIDLILNRANSYTCFQDREQIKSMREYVNFFLSLLENSPEKTHLVEAKIRDLAHEAEDVIEFSMSNRIPVKSRIFLDSRGSFQRRLKRVTKRLGLIAGDMMNDGSCCAISSPTVPATAKNDVVVGLDEDLIEIKGRLCGESSKLEIIPIVGMGGIGKTTLARCAYDDPLVMGYFHVCAWVTVSQGYSVDEILSRLVDSLKLVEENGSLMAEKVYKCLKGRRYLIVLDDVWSTEVWNDVRNIFPDDKNGSRIILTTRLSDVAAYPDYRGSSVHSMKFMDENQCWNLLKQKVFTDDEDCPSELEDIGKAISGVCGGLPLAIVLVAGVLSTIDKTRVSWEKIAKNVISVVDDHGQLEKILSLSYTHLPHCLRSCFLYICGFPEDYEINASKLIKLWVAEGFLKCENGCKSLEERAEEFLEDLVKRSLVLVNRRKAGGEIKSCSLHDLVRDSCTRKAHKEKFLLHAMGRYNLHKNMRRVCTIDHPHLKKIRGPTIHTFLCLRLLNNSSLPAFVGRFRLLRVLDVICDYMGVLPLELFELIHLRYLALGFPGDIPAAISNLENLQTLMIRPKPGRPYRYLPLEIWRMQKLRHLLFPPQYILLNPVDGSTLPLQNLQTLSGALGPGCSNDVLKMTPNLKQMNIIYFEHQDVCLQNLLHLHQLEKLKLTSYNVASQWLTPAFPTMLKQLSLVGCHLSWRKMSVIGLLPDLRVLKLKYCVPPYDSSDTWETTEGEFLQLRFLLIEGSSLKYWITESSHFPRLKTLVLRWCDSLSVIPEGIGEIPTLELIELDGLNQSLSDSAKQIQEEQLDYGNDSLQVSCIRSASQISKR